MACAVKRSDLTDEQYTTMKTMLTMTEAGNNYFNPNAERKTISLYREQGDTIHLPFLYAASLLKIIPNANIVYPKVQIEFTGKIRDYQEPVIVECWKQLQTYGTTSLLLRPGFGKTILGAMMAAALGLVTCIIVHREILTTQWKNTFTKNTNAQVWIVGENKPPPSCHVIVCMSTRWDLIDKRVRDMVGFLLIDEAHSLCVPNARDCLLAFHPSYVAIETATLMRDDEMHNVMYAIVGTHNVSREFNSPFNVVKLVTNTVPERRQKYRRVDFPHLVKTTLFNERRNKIAVDIVVQNKQEKILILTSMVDHAHILHNMVTKAGVSCDFLCGQKKTYQDAAVLIGTTSKIGTGFDAESSCDTYDGRPFNILILMCSIKKYAALVQNVGRALRAKSPTVIHFVDKDSIYEGHWFKARKWYIASGGVIINHVIPNIEEGVEDDSIESFQRDWIASKRLQLKAKTT